MAKTKFLSRVLAVIMALSMLCSTGVFADYGTGNHAATAEDPEIIVITNMKLNDTVNLNQAISEDTEKWVDVAKGIKIDIAGEVANVAEDIEGDAVTYHLVEKGALEAIPLDLDAVEDATLAIGTLDVGADGSFAGAIEVAPTHPNFAKDKTYELRYAYSYAGIEGTWVYQRYIETFDWADVKTEASYNVTKDGIPNPITIEIEGNPARDKRFGDTGAHTAYRNAVKYIRTDNLQNGSIVQTASASVQNTHRLYEQKNWVGTSGRGVIVGDVGAKLLGGVVLGDAGASDLSDGHTQHGNIGYRFKATNSGVVYLVANCSMTYPGWTVMCSSEPKDEYAYGIGNSSHGYLYVPAETDDPENGVYNGTFSLMSGSNKAPVVDMEGVAIASSWFTPDGYLKMPSDNYDENGNWKYNMLYKHNGTALTAEDRPYIMDRMIVSSGNGSEDGRGYVYQGHQCKYSYQRTFTAGEWVEVPYTSSASSWNEGYAVVQFYKPAELDTLSYKVGAADAVEITKSLEDNACTVSLPAGTTDAIELVATITGDGSVEYVPETVELDAAKQRDTIKAIVKHADGVVAGEYDVTFAWEKAPALVSATVTTTKSAFFSDALEMLSEEEVELDAENPTIIVPRGTETVSFTVTDVNGKVSEAATATMTNLTNVAIAKIGAFEYAVTVKFDDAQPTIYNYVNNYSYDGANRIALQYGDKSNVLINGKKTNLPDGAKLSAQTFAKGATKPALDKDLLVIGTYANQGQAHMKDFKWKETDHADGMTFNVSAPATVYVLSVARGYVGSENLETAGFVANGTINGYPLYARHYNAGDLVSIPTEPVTQAEIDAYNATSAVKEGTKYIFVDDTNKDVSVEGSATGKAGSHGLGKAILFNVDADGNPVSAVASTSDADKPYHFVRGQSTIFYVEFDKPLALGEVTYTVDGGEEEAVTFADGETTANIEVPFNATTVSVAATKTGTGTVTVSDALDLSAAASGAITVTLAAPSGEPVVYTINFTKGAPSLFWEAGILPTGKLKTQGQGPENRRNLYADGLYGVADAEGEAKLDPTNPTVNLTVPYGVETISLIGGAPIDLFNAENHAVTTTVTIAGIEYTVNVAWAPYAYDASNAEMPLLYDLEYFVEGKTSLWATNRYYAIPKNLVLDEDHDLVLGEGDLKGTRADGSDRETITHEVKAGTWYTIGSHNKVNLSSTNNGSQVNRLHLAPSTFESWVTNGDLDDKYALNGATSIIADYTDVVDHGAVRYKFKTAVDGYVIVASKVENTALTAADGWTRLEGNTMVFTNASTGAQGDQLAKPPIIDGVEWVNAATSYAKDDGNCNYIYIKKVVANEAVEIKESTVSSQYPPVVIVATEDMINERIAAPTVLKTLSYTTTLAVTDPASSAGANARYNNKSLHAYGYYQPTLVKTATAVEIGEGNVINVTVPYGTEIVNLAGKDTYEGAVEFDAINLINNNGAATVTKTVGEIVYTINVAWAAFGADDAVKNMVYDVKYRIKDLAASNYYNLVPNKLVLEETRRTRGNKILYADAALTKVLAEAGAWVETGDLNGKGSNLLVQNKGGSAIARGRITVDGFAPWVKSGLITVSGAPAVPNPEAVDTDAEVDAIAYAAMNGATTLVANYQDFANKDAAEGANAGMDSVMSFRVAQDSIIYVTSGYYTPGEGWTAYETEHLNLIDANSRTGTGASDTKGYIAADEEGAEPTMVNAIYALNSARAGTNVFYRYAKKDELVTLAAPTAQNDQFAPVVIIREVDFDAFEAPAIDTLTFKVGDDEAQVIEDASEVITIPWGTTDAISVKATITGAGGVGISEDITLSKDAPTGEIVVTLTDVFGEVVDTNTIKFAWGAAPTLDALTYSTATTLYKAATVKDVAIEEGNYDITVPYGTATATVSYKLSNMDKAVALDAVTVPGAVEVELPEETITITFAYGAAPAGQYITNLTKNGNWTDRVFVSYGDLDDAYLAADKNYTGTTYTFFTKSAEEYSSRVPEGLAKRGEVAVIADASANVAYTHMKHSTFPYMYGDYPATEAANAWMTFTVAKAGYVYYAPSSFDDTWAEGEALGWTEAPFGMKWSAGERKVYQKRVAAGETVLMPNNKVTDAEIAAMNATLTDYQFVKVEQADIDKMQEALDAKWGLTEDGKSIYKISGVEEGDWIAKYTDEYLASPGEKEENYAGFDFSKFDKKDAQMTHYSRDKKIYALFAVADDNVAAELRAPQYNGGNILPADGAIDLTANPIYYGEKSADEITYEIKSGSEYAYIEDGKLVAIRENYVDEAAVVLVIKQGEATSEATIALAPVDVSKYGFLTIEEADFGGNVVGSVGDKVVIQDTTYGPKEFLNGETVTLRAIPKEGYAFQYWALVNADKTLTVYNNSHVLNFTVANNNITLKAIFKAIESDSYTITFIGYQGKIIASYDLGSVPGDSITVPPAPPVFGHTCNLYTVEGILTDVEPGTELSKTLFEHDTVYYAKYVQNESMNYTLKVENGTAVLKGVNMGSETKVTYNVDVIVVANDAEEGMKFSHWEDVDGNTISYEPSYKFYMAAADRTVKAMYTEAEATVAIKPITTLAVTEVETDLFGLFAERRVLGDDYTVIQNGIVYGYIGNDYGLTEESESVTLDNYNGRSVSQYQNKNGQYTVRVLMTEARKSKPGSWYASSFLTYKDANGAIYTIYSPKALVWEKVSE